ncbi:MAG: hypothetical protein WCE36_01545, partial [Pseudolabrys sp.]
TSDVRYFDMTVRRYVCHNSLPLGPTSRCFEPPASNLSARLSAHFSEACRNSGKPIYFDR